MSNEYEELKLLKQDTYNQIIIRKITKAQKLYFKSLGWVSVAGLFYFFGFLMLAMKFCGVTITSDIITNMLLLGLFSTSISNIIENRYNKQKKIVKHYFEIRNRRLKKLDKNKELKKEKDMELQQELVKSKLNSQEEIAMEQKYDSYFWQQLTREQKLELLNLYKEQVKELEEKEKDVSKTKVIRK